MDELHNSENEIIPLNEETQIDLPRVSDENELALAIPSGNQIIPLNEETQISLPRVSNENELALAIPGNSETQIALPSDGSQGALAQSEVVVAGGNYHGAVIGPQTNKKVLKASANDYRNSKITNIHYHYGGDNGIDAPSTSSPEVPKGRETEASQIEEGYAQLSEDIFIYDKEPLRDGTRIYKGYQRHASGVRRLLAIKMVVPCTDAHVKEVQHLVKLGSHPNVVQIIHSKERQGPPRVLYIAMELCSSQNLQDYLDEMRELNVPFDFKKTMSFSKQLVGAMVHIHGHKIVHRDIKPENVLLSSDKNHLKVTDFGLGKQLQPGRSATKTHTGGQGTFGYIAPEMYLSDEITQHADVFSLGITFHNLYTNGKHPFGTDPDLFVHNIKKNKGHDFSGLLIYGRKRDEFLDLIGKMLQHDPRLRPTMKEVADHPFFKDDQSLSEVSSGQVGIEISEQNRPELDLAEELSNSLPLSERGFVPTVETIPKEVSTEEPPRSAPDVTPSVLENLVAFEIEGFDASHLPCMEPSSCNEAVEAAQSQRFQESTSQEPETSSGPVSLEQTKTVTSHESTSTTPRQTRPTGTEQASAVKERVKIVIVGNVAVGKTALVIRHMTDRYRESIVPTTTDFNTRLIEVDDKKVFLQIWDTAGDRRFDELRALYYRGADLILICFSVSQPESLEDVTERWFPQIRRHLPDTPIILVGNKIDIRNDPRLIDWLQERHEKPVKEEDGQSMARQIGAKICLECSAKTGDGVREVFEQAVRVVRETLHAPDKKVESKSRCVVS